MARVTSRGRSKAACVQLVQQGGGGESLEIRGWEQVPCPLVQVQIAFGCEQGEAMLRKTETRTRPSCAVSEALTRT